MDILELGKEKVEKKLLFRGDKFFLSNMSTSWDIHSIQNNLVITNNVESAFQLYKVLHNIMNEDEVNEYIKKCSFIHPTGDNTYAWNIVEPKDIKKRGRKIKLDIEEWDKVKDNVMYNLVVKSKFQLPYLKHKLLKTDDSELVEYNTWGDKYWGVCLKTNTGLNKLGNILKDGKYSMDKINVPFKEYDIVNGDILDYADVSRHENKVIMHLCNIKNIMGAGVAKRLVNVYPEINKREKRLYGSIDINEVSDDLKIINLYAMKDIGVCKEFETVDERYETLSLTFLLALYELIHVYKLKEVEIIVPEIGGKRASLNAEWVFDMLRFYIAKVEGIMNGDFKVSLRLVKYES